MLRSRAGRIAGCVCIALVAAGGCGRAPADGSPLRVSMQFGETGLDPGQFSYPRAMDANDGHLWIIDKLARVQRIDAATGAARGEFRLPEWDLGKPTGVTAWTDETGTEWVFVADTHYHRVMIYRAANDASQPAAEFVRSFGEYGQGDGQFIYPTDVAVLPGPDGRSIARLYVSEYGGNDRISIWEPDERGGFRFVASFGSMGINTEPGMVEFRRPQSIVLDPERQRLIAADSCNHRLGVLTLDGQLIRWIGEDGEMDLTAEAPAESSTLFSYPYGLALLADGTVLVSEFGASHVRHIDPERGESLGIYGRRGRGSGELATPWAVSVVGETAYVLDSGNNRVVGFERPPLMRGRMAEGAR